MFTFPTTLFTPAPAGGSTIAADFLAAQGATGATQIAALEALVDDLEGNGSTTNNTDVMSDLLACWPMLPIDGSTTSLDAFKWNLVNPVDSDAGFRLTYFNTPTTSNGGLQGDGVNQYANTHFIPSSDGTEDDFSFAFCADVTTANKWPMGSYNSSTQIVATKRTGSTSTIGIGKGVTSVGVDQRTPFRMIATRESDSVAKFYSSGTLVKTDSGTSNTLPTIDTYLLAMNLAGSPALHSLTEICFACVGNGLSASQAKDLDDSIATYNTALSR